MNRRQFTKTAGLGIAGSTASLAFPAAGEEIIDIHQHINFHARSNEELIAHQEKMGVSKTVLLPSGSALARASTNKGKSNGLAARVFGTFAAARVAKAHPDSFVFFCNEIPDLENTTKDLEKWLENGACGIGEQKFHLDCDSAPMMRLYEVAQAYEVPVLLHFQHGSYNTGFERFHKVLEKFPKVSFIGHAQTWWGNIDADLVQTDLYPKTKVTPGGLTDRYLSDYSNMFGDLSAGSGKNALDRDPEHAVAFLDRHQDKLLLGTDCADAVGEGDKCSGSGQIANVMKYVKDPEARSKILSGNAKESSNWTRCLAALVLAGAGMTSAVEVELPVIIAHRGASAVAPENTKSAIVEACRMGAKVIEFDVRQTADGELVLFHDKDLERIAGSKDSFESKEWDEISQLDVGKWFGETFTGEKPIRLKEAIELCRDGGAIALIEHKTGDAERYAGVIRGLKAGGEVIVQSFNWQFLQEFQVAMDSVRTGALGSKELSGERLGQLKALAPDWVGWKFSDLSEANLKSLQGQGYRVALWTVNDPEEARKWLERGVEGVITDYPDKMLELLEAE